ncbi:ion transporter [Ferrimonas balearica]|uniref:ion transporter n=1 Tax=Ferrimonas balearica TaxID=44012 RepID=UPI001C99AC22|nr:ion transporter [Ferrimonas balearica]MBY5990946.1 ion transporter [Ferrimonas balearica]
MTDRKTRWRRVIFATDTQAGHRFDLALILVILASVLAAMLDSVESLHQQYGRLFYLLEWGFTLLFTLEYAVRLWVSEHRRAYAFSFYGLVDLLSILPTYLSLLFPGTHYLLTIRALRLLRIFRVMKLAKFMGEASQLTQALVRTRRKIAVFMFSVLVVIIIFGSLMYVIEGPQNGFTSIPRSIYWAIVTITTVGYGDISPQTPLGQLIASLAMMTGYGIIAVPTGIVTAEISVARTRWNREKSCSACHCDDHDADARYCKRCGAELLTPSE